ncbi:DUF2515 domain-containing protein [Geobacillus sp. Y412MC52]|uniref:DUF2515 domain-containing protein n=1 Tax=Geobacillus sp. (strain Y412MC52) TaxID=550542 RepID=UPI00018C1CB2|nr:DUF2515 domain-containing protein [Geobacillus sp. Y412MC52]ADU94370.1 Protein of unknown function DUF2515 [Geobacillus sp. Y412MC52]
MRCLKPKTSSLPLSLLDVYRELKRKQKQNNAPISECDLTAKERQLIRRIQAVTAEQNENNVTRTATYLDFYLRHREIHWAFLGHMVSRNGGWNMTDLKGELLMRLLSEDERQSFFAFLERGNWLIFQDIYPQFLLYEESKKRGEPLFYLLPWLGVSTFMETIWNHFWRHGDPYTLAIALVINEQSYLEQRVIQHPAFRQTVFQTMEFKLQKLLHLNHILFPYDDGRGGTSLIGQTLHQFESLHERILLGKRLYAILFDDSETLEKIVHWASSHPHTGSRKDYWAHLFNDVCESFPREPYRRRIRDCRIVPGAPRLYSPQLRHAWKNVVHESAEPGDWFTTPHVVRYLVKMEQSVNGEIVDAYCETLEKMELAIIAKNAFFHAR